MLEEKAKQLLSGANYAALTTLLPDGRPQTHLVWADHDGKYALVNTEIHRQKARNVTRDPRVSLLVWDREDMWSWAEVRGDVVDIVRGQEARDHIDKLAKKYLGVDGYRNPIQTERVILRIAPSRQLIR